MKKHLFSLILLIAGALLFQSFQCASPEFTTGKLAMRNRDYVKAEASLKKELAKNPKNVEARLLLAQALVKLNKWKDAAENLNEVEKNAVENKWKYEAAIEKYRLWANSYNIAISYVNKYQTQKKPELLDTALNFMNVAVLVRPKNPENYRVIGRIYDNLGQKDKAIENYKAYLEKLGKEIDFAKKHKIYLYMDRDKALEILGKPVLTKGTKDYGDSTLTDLYSIDKKDVYLFYSMNEKKRFILEGWTVDPPKNWLPGEQSQWTPINIYPIATLADIYFQKKDMAKAKRYTKIVTTIDPTNVSANRFLIQIYLAEGKKDEAMKEIANLIKTDPNNKFYRAQYGDLNFAVKNYDEAIKQYKKALEIDPDFCDAARNLGASLKNKAVEIINAQEDRKDKDKNYKGEPEKYMPLLKESAKYFEKSRTCDKYKNDIIVLGELANIYLVTNEKSKLDLIIDDLERLEPTIPDNQKETYWLQLCKIFSTLKIKDKQEKACGEANKYIQK